MLALSHQSRPLAPHRPSNGPRHTSIPSLSTPLKLCPYDLWPHRQTPLPPTAPPWTAAKESTAGAQPLWGRCRRKLASVKPLASGGRNPRQRQRAGGEQVARRRGKLGAPLRAVSSASICVVLCSQLVFFPKSFPCKYCSSSLVGQDDGRGLQQRELCTTMPRTRKEKER